MMAALLYPERRVLAVCGDGGFMMNSQEMETAVRLKLNLVVMMLNDSAYGMIRWKQAVDKFPDFGLTFGNPDFVKYAEAYGAKGSRVDGRRRISCRRSRRRSRAAACISIDVPIDYSENVRVLVDELKHRVKRDRARVKTHDCAERNCRSCKPTIARRSPRSTPTTLPRWS